MPTDVLTLPERAGSRGEAQTLLGRLPRDLSGTVVHLDGVHLEAGSSSFMDELVKEVLVERHADQLRLDDITERAGAFALTSAARRGVADRLKSSYRRSEGEAR
jgi:hypothetical protein